MPGDCKASITDYHKLIKYVDLMVKGRVCNCKCLCKLRRTHFCTQRVHCAEQASFIKCWQEGTDPQDLVCEVCVLQTRPLAGRLTLALALWPLNLDHPLAIDLADQCCDEICK